MSAPAEPAFQHRQPARPTSPTVPAPAADPVRLGVHVAGDGLDIAVCAPHATALEFCVFSSLDPDARETRYQLLGPVEGVWHGHLPRHGAGTIYGLRAWGPWHPAAGHVYNPAKLLLDPYGRAVGGGFDAEAEDLIYAHVTDDNFYPLQPMRPDGRDSAPVVPRSVVSTPGFPIAPKPHTPWERTVIYEAHVRGLTMDMPGVPAQLRGTYAGLAHPSTVNYLQRLGVTAIELLPIHAKHDELFLAERGLTNYWGYSTLSYFAPEPSYATRDAQQAGPLAVLDELRGMVSILHQAGIEVILDVVYNHTCENSMTGRTLSLRGLDNYLYYLHDPASPSTSWDTTGCGNTLDFSRHRVIQLALDSLRYWATEIGIDGFRFDLAATLGRFGMGFTRDHPFLVAAATDPILATTKLIAEPWDIGPDGWQTGAFPVPFGDWNDRFRDCLRTFWVTDQASQAGGGREVGALSDLATRLSGSADLFSGGQLPAGRGPRASINFITAHDGFTLADLVSYNDKHNHDNLESNRDGSTHNRSWNHGVEGRATPTQLETDHAVNSAAAGQYPTHSRLRTARNLIGSLLIAAGTPMLVAGDEAGRTQGGNNNAYCQDNEISWLDWEWRDWQQQLFDTTRHLIDLRMKHPVLRPDRFATGANAPGDMIPDLSWYSRSGQRLAPHDWHNFDSRAIQMLRSGFPWGDRDLLVLINGTCSEVTFSLATGRLDPWHLRWDSAWDSPTPNGHGHQVGGMARARTMHEPGATVSVGAQSMQVFLT